MYIQVFFLQSKFLHTNNAAHTGQVEQVNMQQLINQVIVSKLNYLLSDGIGFPSYIQQYVE